MTAILNDEVGSFIAFLLDVFCAKVSNFTENKKIAKQGGSIAGNTRKEIEEKTGKKVVSDLKAKVNTKNKLR